MAREHHLEELRSRFEAEQGFWNESWQKVLEADPDFFATFIELAGVPWRNGALEPKFKEFVHITVAGAATHLYEPGVRLHIRRALELGATREEIVEVLQLTATLGIHACNIGVPTMIAAFREAGEPIDEGPLSERQRELKSAFERDRGYWHDFWDGLLRLDPDFFAAYLDLSSFPWRRGVLAPKAKEMIYIAFDAAATHMFMPGLKLHIENAIGYGATPQEIIEVLEIASTLGIHALATAIPILDQELARAEGRAVDG
jgi:alkylhydroperoxidase/carboxymuconolactone decarboxylase family protein YurZ